MSWGSKIAKAVARTGIAIYNGANYVSGHPEVLATVAAINPAAAGIVQGIAVTGNAVKAAKETQTHGGPTQPAQPVPVAAPEATQGVRGDVQDQAAGDRQ